MCCGRTNQKIKRYGYKKKKICTLILLLKQKVKMNQIDIKKKIIRGKKCF